MAILKKPEKLPLHWLVNGTECVTRVTRERKCSYIPAVDSYWAVLTELLFCLVNLTYEIYKSITRLGHALLWPVNKLELADSAGTTISCICYFELSQYVLWHIVFSNGIHYKALISHWAVTGPVLMAFLLERNQYNYNIVIKSYTYSVNNCPTRCDYIQFYYISADGSTRFGWYPHPSSGAHATVRWRRGVGTAVPTPPRQRMVANTVRPVPDVVITVWECSWWWMRVSSETCRAICRNIIKLYVVASRWMIIDIDSRCMDPWT